MHGLGKYIWKDMSDESSRKFNILTLVVMTGIVLIFLLISGIFDLILEQKRQRINSATLSIDIEFVHEKAVCDRIEEVCKKQALKKFPWYYVSWAFCDQDKNPQFCPLGRTIDPDEPLFTQGFEYTSAIEKAQKNSLDKGIVEIQHTQQNTTTTITTKTDLTGIIVTDRFLKRLGLDPATARFMDAYWKDDEKNDLYTFRLPIAGIIRPGISTREFFVSEPLFQELENLRFGQEKSYEQATVYLKLDHITNYFAVMKDFGAIQDSIGQNINCIGKTFIEDFIRLLEFFGLTQRFILVLFVILIVLLILITFFTYVLRKQSDIGILRAYGTFPVTILEIISAESFLLAFVSVILGIGLCFLLISLALPSLNEWLKNMEMIAADSPLTFLQFVQSIKWTIACVTVGIIGISMITSFFPWLWACKYRTILSLIRFKV